MQKAPRYDVVGWRRSRKIYAWRRLIVQRERLGLPLRRGGDEPYACIVGLASEARPPLDDRQREPAVPQLAEALPIPPPLPGSPSSVRSPLRLSPVNSSSELGGAEVGVDGGAGGGVSAAKQDAVYQAFVRQWCFGGVVHEVQLLEKCHCAFGHGSLTLLLFDILLLLLALLRQGQRKGYGGGRLRGGRV